MISANLIINGREETSDRTIDVVSPADIRVLLGSVPDAAPGRSTKRSQLLQWRSQNGHRGPPWKNAREHYLPLQARSTT